MEEIWKAIPGYEGIYEASNCGRIRSVDRVSVGRWGHNKRRSHILTQTKCHGEYRQVRFSIDGIKSQPLVHRLVAQTFIPNPHNLPQVNHKDGDAANNHVDNLEWCTASQNCIHRGRVLGKWVGHQKQPVRCINNGIVYESSHHAAKALGVRQGSVFLICQKKMRQTHGFSFEFV